MPPLEFTRANLAAVARDLGSRQLAGDEHEAGPAIEPFLAHFRADPRVGFAWAAAFVYHCVHTAGLELPPRIGLGVADAFTQVGAWIVWASGPGTAHYFPVGTSGFVPDVGDLIVFDDLFGNGLHDHIGVVVDRTDHAYVTAEGDVKNRTGTFVRRMDRHINGFVLLTEAHEDAEAVVAARAGRLQAAGGAFRGYGWSSGSRRSGRHRD